jgi:hypothetical protein
VPRILEFVKRRVNTRIHRYCHADGVIPGFGRSLAEDDLRNGEFKAEAIVDFA